MKKWVELLKKDVEDLPDTNPHKNPLSEVITHCKDEKVQSQRMHDLPKAMQLVKQ